MRLQFGDVGERVRARGFVTVHEPSCGAGAQIIALAGLLEELGLNPSTRLHVTAVDLDRTAAYMAYVQLSLLNIPAVVRVGDTLTEQIYEELFTPRHLLGGWDRRLRREARATGPRREARVTGPT